jgi:outer membrane protein insertion porin family
MTLASKLVYRLKQLPCFLLLLFLMASCAKPFVKNTPKDAYYLYNNNIVIADKNISKAKKNDLLQKLSGQIEDSIKVKVKTKFYFFKTINKPPVYDTMYCRLSAENMRSALFHSGYYQADVDYKADSSGKKISVDYIVTPGKQTLIEEVRYELGNEELQRLSKVYEPAAILKKDLPISKIGIYSELNRLVDIFRNNGYYKFSAAELKVQGDTSSLALTNISNNPFEQFQLMEEAQRKLDSPKIRLTIRASAPNDSSKLKKYYINNINVYPDADYELVENDSTLKTVNIDQINIYSHYENFHPWQLQRMIPLKKGDVFRQTDYDNTISNLNRIGAWQSINISIDQVKSCDSLIDLNIKLVPFKKIGFESALEVSYSASNSANVLAGNLFGLSGNLTLTNRNVAKDAVKMTHNLRAGIEFNNNTGGSKNFINSNEIGYNNTTTFPRLLFPFIPGIFNKNGNNKKGETFISLGTTYNTRLNLFNLQSSSAGFGWSGVSKKDWRWNWSAFNMGFSRLYNKSDSFELILQNNPFLKFSYNTSFVMGMGVGFSKTFTKNNPQTGIPRVSTLRFTADESGITWANLPVLDQYKRRYIKGDAEFTHTIKKSKTALALRAFTGIGLPLLGSDTNRTLPFFKQYFGGGSNSMRAWPVRGIGPGSSALVPYSNDRTIFNDRRGDIQLELNAEYRYDILKIIPNTLTLKGAVFTDIGNIWNIRNSKTNGTTDSTQFNIKNLYKELGVAAGTGFRLDFNYFVVRFDLGFRLKRPETSFVNDGWKLPNIGFDDFLKKIFTRGNNDEYRKWRYENFNFSIGVGYPF